MRIASTPHSIALRRVFSILLFSFCALALLFAAQPQTASAQAPTTEKHLLIYSIDVEGGQATLLVAPSGASLLVDTGWPTADGRDAQRIQEAMKDAGISRIDHLLVTHFHHDHVGGLPELVKRVPIGEFIDHGVNREDSDITRTDYAAYLKAIEGKPRRIVHSGDAIDIPGLKIVVVTADGEHIASIPDIKPVPNPYCAAEHKWPVDASENARSTGILVTYGKFRFIDLADLTKAKEFALMCPANPIGTVDLYLTTHHGLDQSNSKAIVDALHPRVAIMNNGTHKGGKPEAWKTIHESPGLEDLWQLHTAEDAGSLNTTDALIANLKGGADGSYLKVVANADGGFFVINPRNKMAVAYPRK